MLKLRFQDVLHCKMLSIVVELPLLHLLDPERTDIDGKFVSEFIRAQKPL